MGTVVIFGGYLETVKINTPLDEHFSSFSDKNNLNAVSSQQYIQYLFASLPS